jgi:hypothetical protein
VCWTGTFCDGNTDLKKVFPNHSSPVFILLKQSAGRPFKLKAKGIWNLPDFLCHLNQQKKRKNTSICANGRMGTSDINLHIAGSSQSAMPDNFQLPHTRKNGRRCRLPGRGVRIGVSGSLILQPQTLLGRRGFGPAGDAVELPTTPYNRNHEPSGVGSI